MYLQTFANPEDSKFLDPKLAPKFGDDDVERVRRYEYLDYNVITT